MSELESPTNVVERRSIGTLAAQKGHIRKYLLIFHGAAKLHRGKVKNEQLCPLWNITKKMQLRHFFRYNEDERTDKGLWNFKILMWKVGRRSIGPSGALG